MSEADRAYEAAQRKIARVREAGEVPVALDLSGEKFKNLERLPPDLADLADLTGLQRLNLSNTEVSDLAPLADLTGLQTLFLNDTPVSNLAPLAGLTDLRYLYLDNTPVSNLAPLAGLTGLQALYLNNTPVSDLAPLAGLTDLQLLWINSTQVSDLRPIAGLEPLGTETNNRGLGFMSTLATELDDHLATLSVIEDHAERTLETLAYLRSLPPWPEPYTPAATPDGRPPEPIGGSVESASIPAPQPAPLEVEIRDGVLRPKPSATPLSGARHDRAQQAWAALKDSLDDLADLRLRTGNQLPALNRVLTRLDQALAQDYAASSQIELGFLGERLIAQAQAADETMDAADAAELKTFAAALAVFLERFPDWKAYRVEDAAPAPAPLAPATLNQIDGVVDGLRDRDDVDAIIPQKLKEQIEDVRDEPDNGLSRRGLLDSANNVLGTLAEAVLAGGGWVGGEVRDVAGRFWREFKDHSSKTAARWTVRVVTASVFLEFFAATAIRLRALAQANPDTFSWLLRFLQLIGL